MLGPCCLCPLAYGQEPDFVEAAIYMVPAGPLSGEYVAGCARDRCGYFGKRFGWLKENELLTISRSVYGTFVQQSWFTY
jgi:hypothetical protein